MKSRHQIHLLFTCLFILLTALPAAAQSREQLEDYLRTARQRTDYASLSLQIDRSGGARFNLWLPVKTNDREAVQQALNESLGFPVEFDNEPEGMLDVDSEDDARQTAKSPSWFSGSGQSDEGFSPQGLTRTGRMNFSPLIYVLRPLNLQLLVVGVLFESQIPNLRVTGANPLSLSPATNYYQTQFNINDQSNPIIEVSWGFGLSDIVWKLSPLGVFLLVPMLLTMWMVRSVLKIRDQPARMWGRYFSFFFRFMNLMCLIWIPVCSLSNLGEIISLLFGANNRVLAETTSLAFYFAPPLLVIYLCHLLSGRVYRQVRGVEWSPREVMRKAILTCVFSILPIFFVLLTINTFIVGSRHAGLFLVVGLVCWFLWAQFASRALNLSMYAVTSGDLRDRVFELAERAGVTLKQIYVLPEAKAQMSNAFARSDNAVMLTGSLLRHLSRREVDGIMAHEIGHLKEKHPQMKTCITVVTMVIVNIVALALASIIKLQHSTPVIISLGVGTAMLILHFLSRSNERHADAIAVSLTGDPEGFITGLAKLSRLNLMPLHAGGWGESLDTHPQMTRRLNDVARLHGIPVSRLEDLLSSSDSHESHYSAMAYDEVEGRIFSTDFKKKYSVRSALVLLATILLPPLLLPFLLARFDLHGAALAIAYAGGLVGTFGLYQVVRNFVCSWGQGSLEQRLRARLMQRGFAEAARDGIAVGLSPAAETRKYENYLFWDIGVLWFTKDKLYYVGEESQFVFEHGQVEDVYLEESRAEWLPDKSLFLRWHDSQREASHTLHFLALGSLSVLQARRQLETLHERVRDWLEQAESLALSSESLPVISAPTVEAITSESASNTFHVGLFIKASIQMACISGVFAFALRLSFFEALYAMAIAILIGFIDESPKLFHRPRLSDRNGPAKPKSAPEYQAAAWATESKVATATQDIT